MAISRFTSPDPALQRWSETVTSAINDLQGERRTPDKAVRKSDLSSIEGDISKLKRKSSGSTGSRGTGGQKPYVVSGTDNFTVPPVDGAVIIKEDANAQDLLLPEPQQGLRITFVYNGGTGDIMDIVANASHAIWDSDDVTVTPVAGKTIRVSSVRGIVTVIGLASSWAAHTEAGSTTYV